MWERAPPSLMPQIEAQTCNKEPDLSGDETDMEVGVEMRGRGSTGENPKKLWLALCLYGNPRGSVAEPGRKMGGGKAVKYPLAAKIYGCHELVQALQFVTEERLGMLNMAKMIGE
ncbi:uncharacterized protein N7482_006096 [Penicillium canariense]|uniref:Uncharacterized protein n=1 Tax=Penicillium canariense TaxID=189055 RepID=A0A9W9I642_9EURO|nr:uncharacterized protein N7482_006096 [Penicillium canariense]KAJ5167315.1 hypothetical protein N7482_006096 [Penicillium canariense]